MDVTKETTPSASVRDTPFLTCDCAAGRFAALEDEPSVSSERKWVFRGEFFVTGGARHAAVALVFDADDASFYGREVAALSRNAYVGCGPEVYEFAARVQADKVGGCGRGEKYRADGSGYNDNAGDIDVCGSVFYPVIIEEDVGVSLYAALFHAAVIPGTPDNPEWACPLAEIGSVQRDAENAKIIFDVRVQLRNIHEAGFYHRDVRAANVCLRRYGPGPADIRATLVDHELVVDYAGVEVPAAAKHYERVLFKDLPRAVSPSAPAIEPTSLTRDLGYLAALEFECLSELCADEARPEDIGADLVVSKDLSDASEATCARPIFSYTDDGMPVMHMIDYEEDIVPLAHMVDLVSVDAAHFPDPHVLARIRSEIRHGGFLDAYDMDTISRWDMGDLASNADRLARDVVYERWAQLAVEQGRKIEYEDFDSQPESMRASSIDYVRGIPNTIRLLGYRIVPASSAAAKDRVNSLAPAEIEYAACLEHRRWMEERLSAGWVLGSVRDEARRVHPDLVPYDELSESVKEYDRQSARAMIDLLLEAGLAVVR